MQISNNAMKTSRKTMVERFFDISISQGDFIEKVFTFLDFLEKHKYTIAFLPKQSFLKSRYIDSKL